MEQIPQVESASQNVGIPVESFAVAIKAAWKRKSRAIVGKRYFVGMETKAGILTGGCRSFNLLNNRTIAIFTCSRCKTEKCEARMDAFLDRDQSCGCLGRAHTSHLIETVISAIPVNVQEDIAKEMELGRDSVGEIAVHFDLFGKLA